MKKILLLSFLMVSFSFAQNQETTDNELLPSAIVLHGNTSDDTLDSEASKNDIEPEIKPDAFIKKCEHNSSKKLLYTEFDCPNNYTQINNDWLNDTNMTNASTSTPVEEKGKENEAKKDEVKEVKPQ